MRWYSCANLTQLYLAGACDISFSQLRDILSRSPCLEELSIYKQVVIDVSIPEDVIHLPRLQHMILSNNTTVITRLITELESVPPSAHVTISDGTDLPSLQYLPQGVCRLVPMQITSTTVLRFNAGWGLYLLSPDARLWSYDKSVIHLFLLLRFSDIYANCSRPYPPIPMYLCLPFSNCSYSTTSLWFSRTSYS